MPLPRAFLSVSGRVSGRSRKVPLPRGFLVLSTAGSLAEGRSLAQRLIRHRVAACVNLIRGIESIYRWRGKVERSREALLLIKTTRARLKSLFQLLKAHHSYEVPELVAFPVGQGDPSYLRWLAESCTASRPKKSKKGLTQPRQAQKISDAP